MTRSNLIQRSATPCPPPPDPRKCARTPTSQSATAGIPTLRFSPCAWAKLLYLRDLGPTEIGAFAISHPHKLLHVEDLVLVRQQASAVTVVFDDEAVAEFFEQQAQAGRHPRQFGRIWAHTHPGSSAHPSGTDEETFARVFRGCDWAVMFILAQGGQTYARLRIGQGIDVQLPLAVEVDFTQSFPEANFRRWKDEYDAAVTVEPTWAGFATPHGVTRRMGEPADESDVLDDLDWFGFDPREATDPHMVAAFEEMQALRDA